MSRGSDQLKPGEISSRAVFYDSPTRYDADFYIRKINRLENDMNLMQDELSNARIRLRRAEDFEIKFEMANRQAQILSSDNDRLQKENSLLAVELDKLRLQLHEVASKPEQTDPQLLKLEIEHWKRKCEGAERDSIDKFERLNALSHKPQKDSNKELEEYRRDATDRFERYENEIRQLNRQLSEKDTVDKFVGAKVDRIKQEKDKQIARLNSIIEAQKKQLEQTISEKNQQTMKLKSRYEKIVNLEIQSIHHNLENQQELFNVELKGLRAIIETKNDEIDSLMRRLESNSVSFESEKDQLKAQIKAVTEALYKSERQAELELYNIRERLTSIHAEDLRNIQGKHQNHITILKQNQAENLKLMHLREEDCRKIQAEKVRIEDAYKQRIHAKDVEIKELNYKLSHTGESNSKELHNLHQSLHNITSEKHEVSAGYLQNISFLDQQIKRLTATLQVRNVELKNLQDLLSETKRRCDEFMRQADNKWKGERKEREQERERLRQQKQVVEEQLRQKQQAWRLKERAYQSVKEKDGVEIDRLNCLVTELEKDVARLNSYIKQMDDLLKKQTRKSQIVTLDTGGVRRELTAELDRQQQQLEGIKSMEIDQLKKKYELDIDRLVNDNKRLKSELLNRNIAFENLQEQFRKMQANSKILQRINKDKLIEYQKKMAALNSEITLTQNLYQSFMEAKSRVKKDSRF